MRLRLLGLVVLLLVTAIGQAHAATVNAISCSSTDVQSAITTAANGDTVLLPVCSATWNATVTLPSSKGITLNGNGATITRGTLADFSPLIDLAPNATTSTRVTGFNFTESKASQGYFMRVPSGSETSAKFRIDHCTFTGLQTLRHIGVNAPVYGVIDNNTFTWSGNNEIIHNEAYGAGSAAGWANDVTPGSIEALYIETNTFTNQTSGNPAFFFGGSATQGYYGARTVFRYNTLTMAQVDQHGTAGAIGARWWEIYENTFTVVPNGNQSDYIYLRAGSGVVFNNHKAGSTNGGAGNIKLFEEDTGYPALYQIGRGKNQVLDPAYVWSNDGSMPVSSGSSNVQVDRDYFLSPKPNYTAFTYPHPLTVAAASGTEPVCSQPTTIFCEDWETTTLPGRWVDGNQPTISITSTPANVFQGTKAVQATFPPAPSGGAGWLGTFLTPSGNAGPSGTPGYDHIFARIYLKLAANWQCEPSVNSCGKIMSFYGAQSGISGPYNPYSGLGQAGVRPNGTDYYYGGTVMTKPTVDREATLYQYFPEMSGTFGDNFLGSPTVQIPLNTWVCLEEEFQANTIGGHDGLQRLWVNNALAVEHTGMRWRDTANLQTLMFQLQFSLSPPQQQQYWIDNVVVSTQRIGCLAAGPPVPPSDLVTGPAFFLTVSKGGTGTGTVTGPGINCGTVCTHPYTPNDTVTLAAAPSVGATFTSWSGACSGSGACTVTMSQARNVTATFSSAATYQLLVSTAADRSNSVELNGFTAPPLGNIYVFTRPTTGVTRVRFFLDDPTMAGAPRTTDTTAEYDFNGTAANGTALPFDTATIATGTHTITAAIDLTAGGTTVISGSFTITPGGTVTVAWTDTNSSPNETGTEVYRCVGDLCTPSTAPNNPAASVGANVTSATYTESSITSILGYSVRALGSAGNSAFSAPLYASFHNTTCPCTIFPNSLVPPSAPGPGPLPAIELGVRFRSDVAGYIKGIRFYKHSSDTGTHTGRLWSNTGTLLATVTFTNETASGWQQMLFPTPIAITAGTTYVSSYHTTTGFYSGTGAYFLGTHYGPPVRALANGTDGSNGVYQIGSGGVFPTQTSGANGYYVDIVFDTVP